MTLMAVPLGDEEMMPPILPVTFPLKPELVRPCDGIDTILGDAHPPPGEQRGQPAAALVIGSSANVPLDEVRPRLPYVFTFNPGTSSRTCSLYLDHSRTAS
jgi:hypothetical protein